MIKEFEKLRTITKEEFEELKELLEFYIPFNYEDGTTVYFVSYLDGEQKHIRVK